jgi:hypothetical protein
LLFVSVVLIFNCGSLIIGKSVNFAKYKNNAIIFAQIYFHKKTGVEAPVFL